ncbi:MAG TPA: hypothetical protein VNF47_06695 [Streptosporangiaceae bacterium]|nr:hypothetical protein [Streptosporangiaceae bacterium]
MNGDLTGPAHLRRWAGGWSTTRPSTGIGCSVSRIAVTRRPSLPTVSRHTL